MALLAKEGAQGLILMPSPLFSFDRRHIVKLALARRWPVVAGRREFAEEGVLLSYGIDTFDQFRRAASYVDKILKGAKPGDLPVEQPTTLEFVINMKTAKAIGIKFSNSILVQATKVIK